jgi:hypothetical protein
MPFDPRRKPTESKRSRQMDEMKCEYVSGASVDWPGTNEVPKQCEVSMTLLRLLR